LYALKRKISGRKRGIEKKMNSSQFYQSLGMARVEIVLISQIAMPLVLLPKFKKEILQ